MTKKKSNRGRPKKYDWKHILSEIQKRKKSSRFRKGKDFECSCYCFYIQLQRELRQKWPKKFKVTFDEEEAVVIVTRK